MKRQLEINALSQPLYLSPHPPLATITPLSRTAGSPYRILSGFSSGSILLQWIINCRTVPRFGGFSRFPHHSKRFGNSRSFKRFPHWITHIPAPHVSVLLEEDDPEDTMAKQKTPRGIHEPTHPGPCNLCDVNADFFLRCMGRWWSFCLVGLTLNLFWLTWVFAFVKCSRDEVG
jgi:hypothetical protein